MTNRRAHGFTLLEILVALSLMALLTTVATQGFFQMRTLTRRIQAKQDLHNTARVIYEQLRLDVMSMQQTGSVYLVSTDGSGAVGKGVELVMLRGKQDVLDLTRLSAFDNRADRGGVTDLVWSRWAWDAATRNLSVSASSTRRIFQLSNSWVNSGIEYNGEWFANLPTPRRSAGAGPAQLNDNAYGTGDIEDIGDYQDLLNNVVPISLACTALRIDLVRHDGSVVSADGSTAAVNAIDGVYVDGRVTSILDSRPKMVRILFELTHATGFSETFSFTVQAPGLLPALP